MNFPKPLKRILVVEDDHATKVTYKQKLTIEGYEVLQAKSANETFDILRKEKVDLITLDIMLPGGKNGFDILESLKKDEDYKTIPVVVLTNLDSEEKVAKEIGANDYLVKANTSIEEVVETIKNHLK